MPTFRIMMEATNDSASLQQRSEKPAEVEANGHAGLWFDKFCNQWFVEGATCRCRAEAATQEAPSSSG